MTRGTAYIILPNSSILNSCEFNGDMYEGGHYEDMVERLKRTTSKATFKKEITEFDRQNFDYQSEGDDYFKFYEMPRSHYREKDGTIDFSKEYFDRFFSDYLFWKNASGKPVRFKTRKGEEAPIQVIALSDGKIATFTFGRYIETIQRTGRD